MHPKLERAMPLLEHLYAGGIVIRTETKELLAMEAKLNSEGDWSPKRVFWNALLEYPENYTIHREPRVRFGVTTEKGAIFYGTYPSLDEARACSCPSATIIKLVEDLNWKPS